MPRIWTPEAREKHAKSVKLGWTAERRKTAAETMRRNAKKMWKLRKEGKMPYPKRNAAGHFLNPNGNGNGHDASEMRRRIATVLPREGRTPARLVVEDRESDLIAAYADAKGKGATFAAQVLKRLLIESL